jgi:hypothetical protein
MCLVLVHDGVRAGPEPLVVSPIVRSAPPYSDSRDRDRRPLEPFVAELHNPVTTPEIWVTVRTKHEDRHMLSRTRNGHPGFLLRHDKAPRDPP